MIHIDPTIRLGDILLVIGGIAAFLKMFTSMRDAMRDLAREIGSRDPRAGLLGDMASVKDEQTQHNAWLIEMRAKLGLKL